MKKLAVFVAALSTFAASFVASTPALAAPIAPIVSWDVATLDWELIDNPSTVAVDPFTRPKATLTLEWNSATDSTTDCVTWHVDNNVTPAWTSTLGFNAKTRNSGNVSTAAGASTTEILFTWTEIAALLSLDPSSSHAVQVDVHDVDCATADPFGETVTDSDTIQVLSAPSATPQGWDWWATLALTENVANTTEQPDLGGTVNDDDWIYPGESATFEQAYMYSTSQWDGPISYESNTLNQGTVCVINVVNMDDEFTDPEAANVARGYDYMDIGWIATSIDRSNGDSTYSYYNPREAGGSTTYQWNTLMSSGFNSGAYTFDPTKVNSITRFIFAGNCYDIFNYGTASGSSANTTTALSANNYSSTLRYNPSTTTNWYAKYDYWWHPRTTANIWADIWAARTSAISSETLYLGPVETVIELDEDSIGRGDSVNLSKEWFDGNGQCVAWFVDGAFVSSELAGADGPGTETTNYTFEELIELFELDNTVSHTIEWKIFGQSCASIDESTATPSSSDSVTLEADVASIDGDNPSVAPGESITIDVAWFDGDAQCIATYLDDTLLDTDIAGVDGAGTEQWIYQWSDLVTELNLDPSVEYTIRWEIYNGACDDIDLDVDTPMDSLTFDMEALEPSVEFDVPEAGPGDDIGFEVTWSNPDQCVAVFVDDEFMLWGVIAPNDEEFGTLTEPGTWRTYMQAVADVIETYGVGELDWSISHTLTYKIYDDVSDPSSDCLGGVEPTISLPSLDSTEVNLLPLAPVIEPSNEEVGPGESSTLDVDKETYGGLVAAHYIDGVFVGCVVVDDIPASVSWDSLDDSYSRSSEHAVTYSIFPLFGDEMDMNACSESTFTGEEPLSSATVLLVPASAPGGGQDDLANTGASVNELGWASAIVAILALGVAVRRRRTQR